MKNKNKPYNVVKQEFEGVVKRMRENKFSLYSPTSKEEIVVSGFCVSLYNTYWAIRIDAEEFVSSFFWVKSETENGYVFEALDNYLDLDYQELVLTFTKGE